jgi:predicted hydrocarbon binding protein
MAQVKGKFITMACSLLENKPEAKADAAQRIKTLAKKDWNQLDPEGWYDTSIFEAVFKAVEKQDGPVLGWASIKTMGRRVYPTIDKTVGLPKNLKTPLEWLKWEGNSFLQDHQGSGVFPRKFLKIEHNHVAVEAISPGYNCALIEGVYEGILEICKIKNYKVVQTRCVKKGDTACEYDITWKEA